MSVGEIFGNRKSFLRITEVLFWKQKKMAEKPFKRFIAWEVTASKNFWSSALASRGVTTFIQLYYLLLIFASVATKQPNSFVHFIVKATKLSHASVLVRQNVLKNSWVSQLIFSDLSCISKHTRLQCDKSTISKKNVEKKSAEN